MRSISAASLAKLAQNQGTEPIAIIEIQWVMDGPRDAYADRDIGSVKGKILEVSGLDAVVQVSGGSDSQQISITLDDTEGSIKAILDSQDIHKRPCWVYQWFEGLPLDEKFLIFRGQISSPINWNEGDRTVSFDVISKIEDAEVGFSIEEGAFPQVDPDLIGKPWPLCFGTVVNVPALKVSKLVEGTLLEGVGIHDFTLPHQIEQAKKTECPKEGISIQGGIQDLNISPQEDPQCALDKCVEIYTLELALSEQLAHEYPTIKILNGEKFPQGVNLTLDIGGGYFNGEFSGNVFKISSRTHPDQLKPPTPQQLEKITLCLGGGSSIITSKFGTSDPSAPYLERSSFFWANPGTVAKIAESQEVIYVANIIPSTILRVAAKRNFNGRIELVTVPPSYYTIRQVDYTGYQVMEIVFSKPLSQNGEGWQDDNINVTLTSDVGPSTVDILQWLIDKYTDLDIDTVSFDHVRELIANYRMDFPILTRKNIIQVLEEISYQARCALWLRDDKFYLRYLAEDPQTVAMIQSSDVLVNTLQVTHTPTEELVTKYVAQWTEDYAIEKPNRLILRHNVSKYGTHQEEYDFYCFNHQELVLKAASFWLIRKANTWRRAIFSTPLSKLAVETLDVVELSLNDVSDGPVKADVEKANYNSTENRIDFECWTPIKSGSRVPYVFAWPADIDEQLIFPTLEEIDLGFAGSGDAPGFTVVPPTGHVLAESNLNITSVDLACGGAPVAGLTGPDESPKCRPDHGRRKPSDRGDVMPSKDRSQDNRGSVNGGAGPRSQENGGDNGCCADAKLLAQKALEAANEAKKAAAQAAAEASGNSVNESTEEGRRRKRKDNLKKLPKPDDLPPGTCKYCIFVNWFETTISPTAGNPCVPVPGTEQAEQFCFSDFQTALAFKNNMKSKSNGPGQCSQVVGAEGPASPPADCTLAPSGPGTLIAYQNTGIGEGGFSIVDQPAPE